MKNGELELERGKWFSWLMLPGYLGDGHPPYASPIFVEGVEPKKSGKNILRLRFRNVFYAEGVQDFQVDLRILKHETGFIIAEIADGPQSSRAAVICPIAFDWIKRLCPELWDSNNFKVAMNEHPGQVHKCLDKVFGR